MGLIFRIEIKTCTQTGRSSRGSFGVLFQQSLPLSNIDIIMGHRLESKGGIAWILPKFLLLPSPPEASTVLIGSPHLHPCRFHPCGFHATNMRGKASHRIHEVGQQNYRWWVFVPKKLHTFEHAKFEVSHFKPRSDKQWIMSAHRLWLTGVVFAHVDWGVWV